MTKLNKIWIEGDKYAIRIDWDNDRHQRIAIKDDTPEAVCRALKEAVAMVSSELAHGEI